MLNNGRGLTGRGRFALGWLVLASAVLFFRGAERGILWVEEAYPAAAAIQMSDHSLLPYRDFQFDKPPLSAAAYLLWNARPGWPLRLAGAAYVLLCSALAWALARRWWPDSPARVRWLAAALLAFYLTFGVHSAVLALAPDLLTVAPSLAAMLLLSGGHAVAGGALLGLVIAGLNGKALLLLPLLWFAPPPARPLPALLGAAASAGLLFALAPAGMAEQVWQWGAAYSRATPVASPLAEGMVRTLGWAGFHAAAVIAAAWCLWRERHRAPLLVWLVLALGMAILGFRFAPRYYLPALAPLALAAARGFDLLLPSAPARLALAALLLVPAVRFGPRYFLPPETWNDTAMNRDSAAAAALIGRRAQPADTILVWGYRPDILVYTRLRLSPGAPFLDSQPLTGVLADRHLTESAPTFPALARRNRARLAASPDPPVWIVDGLGPYNPALAIGAFADDLAPWLAARYEEAGRTSGTRIYRLRRPAP